MIKTWTKGKYTLGYELNPHTGRPRWRLDDGWCTDWPIRYDDGRVAFDNPEFWPKSILAWATKIVAREA